MPTDPVPRRGNYDLADDVKFAVDTHDFKRLFKEIAGYDRAPIWQTQLVTECDEVQAAALLVTNESLCHAHIAHPMSQNRDIVHPAIP